MNPIQDLGKQERIAFPENKTDIPLESHIEREDKKEEILISAINSSAPVLLQNIEIKSKSTIAQQDFVKKMQFFESQKIISSISENNTLTFYQIQEENEKIELINLWSKEYDQTILYDVILSNQQKNSLFADSQIILSRKDHPVTLYKLNANGGLLDIASFKIYKKNSEKFLSPLSMKLKKNGTLIAGGASFLFSYDLYGLKEKMVSKSFKKNEIVSTIDIPNENYQNYELVKEVVAIGKFDKKLVLFSQENDQILFEMKGHIGGITHLKFMPSNNIYLFSGGRKDNIVYLWDLRKTDEFLTFFERKCNTNQRMYFDISNDGQEIFLGNQDGTLVSYKIYNGQINSFISAHDDCLNSIVFVEDKKNYLVTSSGQRTFAISSLHSNNDFSNSSFSDEEENKEEQQSILQVKNNCIKFWGLCNQ